MSVLSLYRSKSIKTTSYSPAWHPNVQVLLYAMMSVLTQYQAYGLRGSFKAGYIKNLRFSINLDEIGNRYKLQSSLIYLCRKNHVVLAIKILAFYNNNCLVWTAFSPNFNNLLELKWTQCSFLLSKLQFSTLCIPSLKLIPHFSLIVQSAHMWL